MLANSRGARQGVGGFGAHTGPRTWDILTRSGGEAFRDNIELGSGALVAARRRNRERRARTGPFNRGFATVDSFRSRMQKI